MLWPIDYYPSVTSSFGEPRPGRFHMGVDFRSGGVTGKEVYSPGDGYVSRIRTSPYGYGKGLYIKLDTGETIVFGHLSGYMPEIEDALFKARIAHRSYDVQLWPDSDRFRVKKGQVVAYSGDTGSGGPHLHMEVRDEVQRPMNPLSYGLEVADTIPPQLNSIVLIPLDADSRIDGLPTAQWYTQASLASSRPLLSGRVGIALSVWDRANNARNLMGIYKGSLTVDDKEIFSKCYEIISYDENSLGGLDYLSGSSYGGKGYLSALFRREGNGLSMYEGDGIIEKLNPVPPGTHHIAINLLDKEDNRTNAAFDVSYGNAPVIKSCGRDGTDRLVFSTQAGDASLAQCTVSLYTSGSWEDVITEQLTGDRADIYRDMAVMKPGLYRVTATDEHGLTARPATFRLGGTSADPAIKLDPTFSHDAIYITIQSTGETGSFPHIEISGSPHIDGEPQVLAVDPCTWMGVVPVSHTGSYDLTVTASAWSPSGNLIETQEHIAFSYVKPGTSLTASSPDGRFAIEVPSDALYRPSTVVVNETEIASSQGLKALTGGYQVTWGDTPLHKAPSLFLALEEEPPDDAGLFVKSKRGWRFLSRKVVKRHFTTTYGGPGIFAVLRDTTPPYVRPVAPTPGGTITDTTPEIIMSLEDKGAGIGGSDAISMSIDGIPIYGEYDFEAHRVTYSVRNPLSSGTHTVTATVRDNVNNSREKSWTFTIQ